MADLDDIAKTCVALHVRMTARAVTRLYDEMLRGTGLKATQLMLLAALRSGAFASVTELADRLALERTSLTRNLQFLAGAGLIEPAEAGGRAATYRVTPKGEAMIRNAMPAWEKAQQRLVGGLDGPLWTETRERLRDIRRAARSRRP